ncbi:MAG TPA: DoxX family protein [Chloroflexota bacterium]|jgi:uncharacterized membrane protein YphA (DoxX/SURF4 family)
MNVVLWIVQILLALVFLGAGGSKLVTPVEQLMAQMPLPLPAPEFTLRLIGTLEVLGAIGLILPWLLRIRPMLTPIAAACLALEMVVATAYTVIGMGFGPAMMPLVLALVSAAVAVGRWQSASDRDRAVERGASALTSRGRTMSSYKDSTRAPRPR